MSNTAAKPQILVVEDEPDLLRMVTQIVQSIGDVTTAVDGQNALDILNGGLMPDLVVTDLMMPRLDGLGLAKAMKADSHLARIPVIMLTARTRPKDVIAGINSGARFYMTKPFKPDELLKKVRKALGAKK